MSYKKKDLMKHFFASIELLSSVFISVKLQLNNKFLLLLFFEHNNPFLLNTYYSVTIKL